MLLTQTLDKLDALGLFGMVLGLREQLESNQYLNLSFDERLGLLVDREAETRDSRRLALRLKAAKLRQEATVEDLDFRAPRGLDRSVVLSLAQAGWVAAHHNLLITGPTGAGKSFLACALTHAAVRRGHTALYVRTPRLLAELALSRGDGRYVRRLGQLARIGLLVLDDFLLDATQRHRGQGPARGDRRPQPGALDAGGQPTAGRSLASGACWTVTRRWRMPSWTASFNTPTACHSPARRCADASHHPSRNPRCVTISVPRFDEPVAISVAHRSTTIAAKEVISPTDCTSTIDIASTRHRCSSPLAHHRNHRTLHAELTVRFPPFPLYEFAVMRSSVCGRCRTRLLGRFTDDHIFDVPSTAAQDLIQGGPSIRAEMKSVGHLDRVRRPLPTTFGIRAGTIADDDLDTRVAAEPVGEDVGSAIIEQVNRAVRFEVEEQGAIAPLLAAQSHVVDTQHSRAALPMVILEGMQDAQERIRADGHTDLAREPSATFAAGLQRKGREQFRGAVRSDEHSEPVHHRSVRRRSCAGRLARRRTSDGYARASARSCRARGDRAGAARSDCAAVDSVHHTADTGRPPVWVRLHEPDCRQLRRQPERCTSVRTLPQPMPPS